MFFNDLVNTGTLPAMEKMLAFTEARHKVLVENIANIDTPGYKTQQLDPEKFQASLRQAVQTQRTERGATLELPETDEFGTDEDGRLVVRPKLEPAENILFHDQTNGRVERQMALLAENGMMHQAMVELMNDKFGGLMKAIRGQQI